MIRFKYWCLFCKWKLLRSRGEPEKVGTVGDGIYLKILRTASSFDWRLIPATLPVLERAS